MGVVIEVETAEIKIVGYGTALLSVDLRIYFQGLSTFIFPPTAFKKKETCN